VNLESERRGNRRHRGILGAVVLIFIGVVFLLERNGILDRHMLSQWWPLLLIVIGGWLLVKRLNGRKD
jgi:hypothetical protein